VSAPLSATNASRGWSGWLFDQLFNSEIMQVTGILRVFKASDRQRATRNLLKIFVEDTKQLILRPPKASHGAQIIG
jgi:hypothetical protein